MARLNFGVHIIVILCVVQLSWSDYSFRPDWEEPDAFSQKKTLQSGKPSHLNVDDTHKCQACTNAKDDNLTLLYQKLVKYLLKRKSMKFEESSRTYYRSLHLHVSEEQMNRFDKMTDVHDMDQLIAEVLHQSRSGTYELFKEMYLTWKDVFLGYWQLVMSSRQFVIGIQFAGFVLIWFASRRFRFSFSVVGTFFVLFYLYSFLDSECHRKKEIERTAQMIGMKDNPCNTTSFWSYYFGNQNEECKKYLDNSYDVSCTLIDVYEEFINIFVYKQMWNLIDNSVANILKVYATHGIIGGIMVTVICVYLFNNYITLVVNSVFHYLFSMRGSGHRSVNSIRQPNNTGAGDTISTEVLNKILDITRDQTKLNALHLTRLTSNSGVQPIDIVDGNESAEGETVIESETECVQLAATAFVSTDSADSKDKSDESIQDLQQ
ncbi:uncharacterized protein LOC119069228 [Bradysia coprophila]|uniref:uncharacterized protein LOC119069228 n=1 Tax=Bradysia coprophila TaxID=38358 RepID=UPI00187D9DB8|nr:uncharacterized protein LOC119069228 [Bradysia coprophila]